MCGKTFSISAALLAVFFNDGVWSSDETPSVPYIICAAFDYTLAKQMADQGMEWQNVAAWADEFGLTAIELDRRQGVPAEVAGNLISQLIGRFRDRSMTREGFLQLAEKHGESCAALAHQLARSPIIQKKH